MLDRYYCETCRLGTDQPGPQQLCSRCHAGLLDLASEQAWDYLRERGQSLHDQRQRFTVGFGAITLSIPSMALLYQRLDSWGNVFEFLYDLRAEITTLTIATLVVAHFIANKRWPPDPILETSEAARTELELRVRGD